MCVCICVSVCKCVCVCVTSSSVAAVVRWGLWTTSQASRLSYVRAAGSEVNETQKYKHIGSLNIYCISCWVCRCSVQLLLSGRALNCKMFFFTSPSYRRFPMCRIAASSLEISQFSLSVNIRTCRTENRKLLGEEMFHLLVSLKIHWSIDLQLKSWRSCWLMTFLQYLHRRADVGVFFQVVSAVTHCALSLQRNTNVDVMDF